MLLGDSTAVAVGDWRGPLVIGVSTGNKTGLILETKLGKRIWRLGVQKLIPKYVKFGVKAAMAAMAATRASLSSVLLKSVSI